MRSAYVSAPLLVCVMILMVRSIDSLSIASRSKNIYPTPIDDLDSSRNYRVHSKSSSQLSRRSILATVTATMLGTGVSCSGSWLLPETAAAADNEDPFAQLDAIASAFSTTPITRPTPTLEPTSKTSSPSDATAIGQSNTSSDMTAALDEMKKRRQIDPRTHG